ncbi:MAG: hypothetical protein K0R66_1223 [Gammaproteobacteria bacterium]|nr:hypothetical protein [Gammaproteobacteria bacterium]
MKAFYKIMCSAVFSLMAVNSYATVSTYVPSLPPCGTDSNYDWTGVSISFVNYSNQPYPVWLSMATSGGYPPYLTMATGLGNSLTPTFIIPAGTGTTANPGVANNQWFVCMSTIPGDNNFSSAYTINGINGALVFGGTYMSLPTTSASTFVQIPSAGYSTSVSGSYYTSAAAYQPASVTIPYGSTNLPPCTDPVYTSDLPSIPTNGSGVNGSGNRAVPTFNSPGGVADPNSANDLVCLAYYLRNEYGGDHQDQQMLNDLVVMIPPLSTPAAASQDVY